MYSATDSDFIQTSTQGQLWDAEHENDLHLNFRSHLQGKIQGQRMGYRISSRNYVRKCTKMVSSDSDKMVLLFVRSVFSLEFDDCSLVFGTTHHASLLRRIILRLPAVPFVSVNLHPSPSHRLFVSWPVVQKQRWALFEIELF